MKTRPGRRRRTRAVASVLAIVAGFATAPLQAAAPERADVPTAQVTVPSSASGTSRLDGPFAGVAQTPAAHYAARWRRVLPAVAADRLVLDQCRSGSGTCPAPARRLLEIVEAGRRKEGFARIGEINRAVNLAIAAAADELQHGAPDVWSSPLETFESGRGDCEDYAIAKYLALLEAGVAADDLRFMVVRNRRGADHAVLAARLDGRWLVLDNLRFLLLDDRDALVHYSPVAAFGAGEALVVASTAAQPDLHEIR